VAVGDDLALFGIREWPKAAVAVHLPGGTVEPYAFTNISEVVHLGHDVVLERCPDKGGRKLTLTILEHDLTHGRDVETGKPCMSVQGIVGDAFVVGEKKSPQVVVHVPSGKVEPYAAGDGGAKLTPTRAPEPKDVVVAKTRFRFDSGSYGDAGIVAFDAKTNRQLWRALWDEASFPIASRGSLIVKTKTTLVELDPSTGHTLWERGSPGGGTTLVPLSTDAAGSVEAFGVVESPEPGTTFEVLIFQRGAPPEAPWTGKLTGTVVDQGSADSSKPRPDTGVFAGSVRTTTDAHGKYELTLASRGTVTVQTDVAPGGGTAPETKQLPLVAGHGPYKVDLKIVEYDQACK